MKAHLLSFGYDRLKQTGDKGSRKRTNNKWFETQDSIGYWEDFYKQKIVWKAVGRNLAFSLLEEGTFLTAPASFITSCYNEYLLGFLCSNFAKYYILNNSDTTGAGDVMLNIQSLNNIPVPMPERNEKISKLVQKILFNKKHNIETANIEKEIDEIIYKHFEFKNEEIEFIEAQ